MEKIFSLKIDLEEVLGNCFPQILWHMANSGKRSWKGYAAFFSQCPKESIKKLLVDEDNWVREMALKHPHAKDLAAFK